MVTRRVHTVWGAVVGVVLAGPAVAQQAEHLIDADQDITLRVRDWNPEAEGSPVLLLTGGPGFAGEQLRSTAEFVAESRRALLLDQRGTAGSPLTDAQWDAERAEPSGAFTFDGAIADLEAVRKALGLESWTLLGHSWGGLLSMAYAAEHPDRVDGLVLISPAGIDASFWATYQRNLFANADEEMLAALAAARPERNSIPAMIESVRASNRALAPAMIENQAVLPALLAEMAPDRFEPRANLALQSHLMQYDLREVLADFQAPVVVIQGDGDTIGRETVDRIVETLPNAELVVLENCGHWPFLEVPEALHGALVAGLARED